MGIFHAVALKEVVTILIHAIHACHNTAKSKGIHDAQTPILSVSPSSFSLSPIPPAYLKVHTASYHFLENGKIRSFGCSLLVSGVA